MWQSLGGNHKIRSMTHPATPKNQKSAVTLLRPLPLTDFLKSALVHGQVFIIPEDVFYKENLLSSKISGVPIKAFDLLKGWPQK